jgi:hypothetical protein
MDELLAEAQIAYATQEISKKEYKELLLDIQRMERISEDAEFMKIQGKTLTAIQTILSAL